MRAFLSAVLMMASVAAGAQTNALTIDASAVGLHPTRPFLVLSQEVASGATRACAGYTGQDRRRFTGGTAQVELPPSDGCGFAQQYLVSQDGVELTFVMPDAAADLAGLLVDVAETGPCIVSRTEPVNPSPGDLWCHPDAADLQYRGGGVWRPIRGGGGGGGLSPSQIKPYALAAGPEIALGDTQFADAFQDSVDINRISYAEPVLTFESHGRDSLAVTVSVTPPPAYDDAALVGRVTRLEGRSTWNREVGSYDFTSGGVADQYFATGLTLPLTGYGRTVRVTVDAETPDEFQLQELLDKTRVTTVQQASTATGVQFNTDAGDVITMAINNAGGLWVADSDLGTRHSFAVELVEADIADAARARDTSPWSTAKAPGRDTNLGHTTTASQVTITSSTGTSTALSGASGSAAGLMTSTNQAKLDRYPAGCPAGQRLSGTGTGAGQGFGCAPDAVGAGGGLDAAAVNALIADPAKAGNTDAWPKSKLPGDVLYDSAHRDSVFGAFRGADASVDSTTIEVGGTFTADPSIQTLRSITESAWVFNQEVGPRLTFVYVAIRVPVAQDSAVAAGQRALDVTESEIGVFERYPSDAWTRKGTNVSGTVAYYTMQVADLPSGARFLVREQHELDLAGGLIDIDQWRRTLGLAGTHFAEQYPGVSPSRTDTDQLIASATALSPAADLDVDPYQRGEFHVSLELVITQSHSSVSFTQNEAAPDNEDRQFTGSITVFASDLAEEPAFTTSNLEGITLFNVPVYSANTVQGRYYLLLVHDADNGVALYRHWDGDAGASALRMSAEARVTFTPTDAAAAGGGGLDAGGVRDQVRGQLVAGTGVTLTPAGSGSSQTLTITSEPPVQWGRTPTPTSYRLTAVVGATTSAVTITRAFGGNAGVMSGADHQKLDRYPNGCPSGQRLSGGGTGSAFSCAADETGSGGGGGAPTIVEQELASAATITTTDFGTWTEWTDLVTLPAITSGQAGAIVLNAHAVGRVTTTPSGGGDRVYMDLEIARVRGAVTTTVGRVKTYIRNTGNAPNSPAKTPGTNAASQEFASELSEVKSAQTGDVFKLRARILSQVTARTVQVDATDTNLNLMHW